MLNVLKSMDTHGDKKLRLTQILVNQKLILKFVNRKVKIVWEKVNPEHPRAFLQVNYLHFSFKLAGKYLSLNFVSERIKNLRVFRCQVISF